MKRLLCLALAFFCFAACLPSCESGGKKDNCLSVVTASFPLYDFARRLVGDRGEVTLLLKPGEEPHSYEPTPKDILAIQSCDLFLYVGGESDAWVKKLLKGDGKNVNALALMDAVEPLEGDHDHDHGHGDEAGSHTVTYDEHIWTSPVNAMKMVEAISTALAVVDPAGKEAYEVESKAYLADLAALDADVRALVETASRKVLLFGDRFPFLYFTEAYGLEHFAAFSGCSDESEVSAATVAFLIDKVKDEGIPVVFTTELSSGRIADSICTATGAQKMTLHSVANVSRDEAQRGATYLSLMRQNLTALEAALG
jgi:zinc transport system substrate-binding protein